MSFAELQTSAPCVLHGWVVLDETRECPAAVYSHADADIAGMDQVSRERNPETDTQREGASLRRREVAGCSTKVR